MQESDESSSSQRPQLPILAPRSTGASSHRTSSSSGRPPRLSHRSRAGCWTCRARKVKCDEIHPKCGPCTRLSRECDWDHRWNFSDATSSTQVKYSNVLTSGNSVWDPRARSSPSASPILPQRDDLPPFSVLTTDDERERKAETQRPGTYGVVVTPSSFAELPEYAEYAASGSRHTPNNSYTPNFVSRNHLSRSLKRSRTDSNVIVLDRFEDLSPTSAGTFSLPSPDSRRPSLPEGIQYLSINTASTRAGFLFPRSPLSQVMSADKHLTSHFRHYIFPRLFQPRFEGTQHDLFANPIIDAFEIEASRFPPLHHAICAVSALNLAHDQRSTMEEALQHYQQAISPRTAASSPEELSSDGVFLLHFMLFVYDISSPMQYEDGGAELWAIHLNNLQNIVIERHRRLGYEPYGFVLWTICELDMYACLLSKGQCDFFETILQYNMFPPLEQQVPHAAANRSGPYLANEMALFPAVLKLKQVMLFTTVRMAQAAQRFRHEAAHQATLSPGHYAAWASAVASLQGDLTTAWKQTCPDYLVHDPVQLAQSLPPRVRYVFEDALLLYNAATLYSRTSMFPGQRSIPIANYPQIVADTNERVAAIIRIATTQLEAAQLDRRHVVFPLLMAGVITTKAEPKIQAVDLMKGYENSGIGKNSQNFRQLLMAIYDDQRRKADVDGQIANDLDWLSVIKGRRLTMVNCGL